MSELGVAPLPRPLTCRSNFALSGSVFCGEAGGVWRVWEEGDASFLGGIFGLCVVSVVLHAVQFGVILSNSE
jgi:hypothetical protein